MDLSEHKQGLRSRLYQLRKSWDKSSQNEWSNQVSEHLAILLKCHRHQLVGGYAPLDGEPRWYAKFFPDQLALPFPKENIYEFYETNARVADIDNLGHRPCEQWKSKPGPACPDVILVPALAFDKKGNRVGHGGGHYDRLLKNHTEAIKIGLCFEDALISSVPTEHHDQLVDWVITQSQTYACKDFRSPL